LIDSLGNEEKQALLKILLTLLFQTNG